MSTKKGSATPRVHRPISAPPSCVGRRVIEKKEGAKKGCDNTNPPSASSVEEWLEAELKKIVGLEKVKDQIRSFLKNLRLEHRRKEVGLEPLGNNEFDMVFYGNPGTGKTSVARLVPKMLQKMGVLSSHAPFLEVGRGDLVGSYIGATEQNCIAKIKEAKGGFMFIDEAYTLTPEDAGKDFGMKALEIIMQCMTSNEVGRPYFIFAGYKKEMEGFLKSNPGMARRIAYKFHFEDYTTTELVEITLLKAKEKKIVLTPEAVQCLAQLLDSLFPPSVRTIWNGGIANRLLSDSLEALNDRLDPLTATKEQLCTLEKVDLQLGAKNASFAVCALQTALLNPKGLHNSEEFHPAAPAADVPAASSHPPASAASPPSSRESGQIIQTMELKQYFPSAMRRIALLEQEISNIRSASMGKPAQEYSEVGGPKGSHTSRERVEEQDEEERAISDGENDGDDNDNDEKRVARDFKLLVSCCKDATKTSSERDLQSTKILLQRALDLVHEMLNPGQPPRTAKSTEGKEEQQAPAAKQAPISSSQEKDSTPADSPESPETQGIANWLVIAGTGRLSIGDQLPSSWAEGLHYTCDANNCFSVGEAVLAFRSNGCRTLAKVERVSTTALDLQVGRALQKTVAVEKVGKLHETLQAFIQIIFARRQDKSKQQGDSNSKDVLPQQLSDALRKKKNVAIDDFELDVDDQLIVKLKEIELKERQL